VGPRVSHDIVEKKYPCQEWKPSSSAVQPQPSQCTMCDLLGSFLKINGTVIAYLFWESKYVCIATCMSVTTDGGYGLVNGFTDHLYTHHSELQALTTL
jgi:hypothetical protein